MIPLQLAALLLAAFGACSVVFVRDLVRQALLLNVYGVALAVLFVVFQAPDVALSELVVNGIGYPVVLVVTLARVRRQKQRRR